LLESKIGGSQKVIKHRAPRRDRIADENHPVNESKDTTHARRRQDLLAGTVRPSAGRAGTKRSQIFESIDSGAVTIMPSELDGIVADTVNLLKLRLGH